MRLFWGYEGSHVLGYFVIATSFVAGTGTLPVIAVIGDGNKLRSSLRLRSSKDPHCNIWSPMSVST